jgi:DNA-directed RNA polymerase subunit beta
MSKRPTANKRFRKSFGKIKKIVEIPDLIGMQRDSYQRFLQMNVVPEEREEIGLQSVYKSVYSRSRILPEVLLWNLFHIRFAEVKHSVEECSASTEE